jgi:hypothetical protein
MNTHFQGSLLEGMSRQAVPLIHRPFEEADSCKIFTKNLLVIDLVVNFEQKSSY